MADDDQATWNATAGCSVLVGAPAPWDVQQLYLALYIIYSFVAIAGLAAFLYARRYFGRLRKRSAVLVSISLVGALGAFVVIFLREYIGRTNFPCTIILFGHYMILPLVIGPMVAKLRVYMHKVRRVKALGGVSFETVRRVQKRLDLNVAPSMQSRWDGFRGFLSFNTHPDARVVASDDETRATASRHGSTLTNPAGTRTRDGTMDMEGEFTVDKDTLSVMAAAPAAAAAVDSTPTPSASSRRTSSLLPMASRDRTPRQSFLSLAFLPDTGSDVDIEELVRDESQAYGVFLVFLFTMPFLIAFFVRVGVDPVFYHGCRGCQFEEEDTIIVLVLACIMIVPYLVMMFRTWTAPDPLGIVIEARMTFYLGVIFALPIFVLYLSDPGDIQMHLHFSWLSLEASGVLCIMFIQTFAQIYLARRANKMPTSINMLRALENTHIRPLFEEHLVSEFSVENLRFWDRATRYKVYYDQLQPSDRDRIANELADVFVKDEGAMQLNLSHVNRSSLLKALAPAVPGGKAVNVSRDVFDGALKEAYTLMSDGLKRFVSTSKFKSIRTVDLEGDQLRSVEMGFDLDGGIDSYIAHLGSATASARHFSSKSRAGDRRVSFMHLVVPGLPRGRLEGANDTTMKARLGLNAHGGPSATRVSEEQDDEDLP